MKSVHRHPCLHYHDYNYTYFIWYNLANLILNSFWIILEPWDANRNIYLLLFFCSILGMNLFGCKFCKTGPDGSRYCNRKNFDSLLWAIITVFQVLATASLTDKVVAMSLVDVVWPYMCIYIKQTVVVCQNLPSRKLTRTNWSANHRTDHYCCISLVSKSFYFIGFLAILIVLAEIILATYIYIYSEHLISLDEWT